MRDVDISKVDLNLLLTLDAILDRGSVTGAARVLGLTQPTVSHALARLRALLGDALLVRSGRGMVRTPRAEALAPSVRRLLGEVRRVLSEGPGFDPRTSSRAFAIACPDLLVSILPDLLGRIATEAPGVRLDARLPPADLPARLADGAIDLAMLPARDDGAGLVQRVVGQVRFAVIARRGHRAIQKKKLDLRGWLATPHVIVGTADGESLVGGAIARLGHARRVAFVAPSFLAALHAVAHTDWMLAAPRELSERLARDLGLVVVDVPIALPPVRVALVWHERMSADDGHRFLRDLLADVATRALGGRSRPRSR